MNDSRTIVGVMTGTSLDGIDAAVIQVRGTGLNLQPTLLDHASGPLGPVADVLRTWSEGTPLTAGEIAQAATDLGRACVSTITGMEAAADCDLAGVHGQTVFHRPPYSLQLLDPAPLAAALNCPTMYDFRSADLTAGGEGAPITPLSDWLMYRHRRPTAVINLGGFCNLTALPPRDADPDLIDARDLCPCNHLLDGLARSRLDAPLDRDGQAAAAGRPQPVFVERLDRQLEERTRSRRSLGTGDESGTLLDLLQPLSTPDALATLIEALAGFIAARVPTDCGRVILAGGGVHNRTFTAALRRHSEAELILSDAVGIPAAAREAMGVAILTALARDGVPLTLPRVTGRTRDTHFDGCWCLPRFGVDQIP